MKRAAPALGRGTPAQADFLGERAHPLSAKPAAGQANASNASRPRLTLGLPAITPASPPTKRELAPPGPLDRLAGEPLAAWMGRLRDRGVLVPWPPCLPTEGAPLPLKIGITAELIALVGLGFVPEQIGRVMRFYTRGVDYLAALAADSSQRHGINGEPVAPVSDLHRKVALGQLSRTRRCRAEGAP